MVGLDGGDGMNEEARRLADEAATLYRAGDRPEAVERWEQAATLLERGDRRLAAEVDDRLCVAYRETGRWDRARVAGRRAMSRAAEAGDASLELLAAGHLGDVHLVRGELDEALRCYERAEQVARAEHVDAALAGLARRRAEIAMHRDDPATLRMAREAADLAERQGQAYEMGRSLAIQAFALARRGRNQEIDKVLERAQAPARKAGAANELNELRLLAANAYLAAGRVAEALAEATRAATYADEVGNPRMRIQADSLIAGARSRLRESEDRKLDQLLDLAAAVTRIRDPGTLLYAIADAALDLLHCDRAFVLIATEEGAEPRIAAARSRTTTDPGPPSASVVRRAIDERREVIATDLEERSDLREAESIASLGLRSILCVPLVDGRDVIGAIYLDSQEASQQDFSEAVRYVRALAASAAVAVTNARRLEEARVRAEQAAEFAHMIRSPITSIVTLADTVRDSLDDPVWLEEVATGIAERGRRVMAMAEQYLEERRDAWTAVDLAVVTREIVEMLAWDARRKGVVLEHQAEEVAFVLADLDALGRALTACVSSAIKRSPSGSPILLRITVDTDDVVWSIRDHGAPVDVLRLGDGPDGSGLSLARRVVDAHSGRFAVEAHPEGGVMMTIAIPHIIGVDG